MGSPPASLWPTPPLCDYERGFAPQREQRPESDRPSADTETSMLVGLRRSLASVWGRDAKQKLVDSILRRFDVGSLYFYVDNDGVHSCIDGRQRINAILSFLNMNPRDQDNCFPLRMSNEIETEDNREFDELNGLTIVDIEARRNNNPAAQSARERIYDYQVTVVTLSGATRPAEFNLQFTRLNLGTIINAGEKLHAMVGEMRNLCFDDVRIGRHAFLESLSIPIRRFAKERVAAQLVAQVFSLSIDDDFTRARHVELQRFFKEHAEIPARAQEWIGTLSRMFDTLLTVFTETGQRLTNRAISVSVVLFAWKNEMYNDDQLARTYANFVHAFLCRLKWQLAKGFTMDEEYGYFVEFQRHVTQAAVEKPALRGRDRIIAESFDMWRQSGEIPGDARFRERGLGEPADLCQQE